MKKMGTMPRTALAGLALLALTSLTACGQLTIRTWVKVIENDSTGSVTFDLPKAKPLVLQRIQGGFLANIVMDTTTIPAPINGTISLEKVLIAAAEPSALQYICAWKNPDLDSTGTVSLDILGGSGSTQVNANLRTTAGFGGGLETDVSTTTTLTLQGDLLNKFLGAANTGSADGLFATRAPFLGTSELSGIPVIFSLDLGVTNDTTPPVIDADLLANCADYFAEQGTALYNGVNPKSSYLRTWPGDSPQPPRVIKLADLGAQPGDVLRLDTIGVYGELASLEDGNHHEMTGVFSSTDQLLGGDKQKRIPGAIKAGGPAINTGGFLKCVLIFCSFQSSDIAEDFRIDPTTTIVVPPGANYLFVAPLPPSRKWSDNSGFGFGVDVDVNPTS